MVAMSNVDGWYLGVWFHTLVAQKMDILLIGAYNFYHLAITSHGRLPAYLIFEDWRFGVHQFHQNSSIHREISEYALDVAPGRFDVSPLSERIIFLYICARV